MPSLVIREQGQERVVALSEPETVIGRSSKCHVRIHTEQASRQHCRILRTDRGFRLVDDGSSNGTYLNGTRVHEQDLAPGDTITIGPATLFFRMDDPAASVLVPPETTTRAIPIQDRSVQLLLDTVLAAGKVEQTDEFLRLAVDHVIEIARAERGVLYLAEGPELRSAVSRDAGRHDLAELVNLSRSIPKQVRETGKAVYVLDNETAEQEGQSQSMKMYQLRTVMCAPLRVGDRTLGVLYVDSQAKSREYTSTDLALFEGVAGYLSLALENRRAAENSKRTQEERQRKLETENALLRTALERRRHLIGECPDMKSVYATLRKVAPTDATVLVLGESGTGKEAIAHVLHDLSPRSTKPFVVIDCAAIPETLLESELFGYEKGAFTGAAAQKQGKFEAADGGTLFLDEIGELSPGLQVKLLRALEQKTISRVGSVDPVKVDVRIITATNRDLDAMAKKGEFRQDLLFRLKVISITLPPLRDRGNDILLLASHFLDEANRANGRSVRDFSEEAKPAMLRHRWEGNVRELKHRIEQAVILTNHQYLSTDDLNLTAEGDASRSLESARDAFEKGYLLKSLARHDHNVTHTAKALDISRQHLQNLMKKYGLTRGGDES